MTRTPSSQYIITGSGTQFTATLGTAPNDTVIGTPNTAILTVMSSMAASAGGAASSILFGSGTALNIGTSTINFSSPWWGTVSILGSITGTGASVIEVGTGVNLTSTANVTNANTNMVANSNHAFRNNGNLTINAGLVASTASMAATIWLAAPAGSLNINGGTIESSNAAGSSFAIVNNSSGTITIINGTISANGPSGQAIWNASLGTVNVQGGTVQALGPSGPNRIAIFSNSAGTINITGGTVQGTDNAIGVAPGSGYTVNITPLSLNGTNVTPAFTWP